MKRNGFSQSIQGVLFACLVVYLTGCASPPDSLLSVQTMQVGGLEVISRNPEVELVIFKTPDDQERFCLGPPPDSVTTFGEGGGLSVGQFAGDGGASEGISLGQGEGALALGGRGEAILITRELMYRACEVALNINAQPDVALQIYRETLQAVVAIAKTVHDAGSPPLNALAPDGSKKMPMAEGWDDSDGDDEDDDEDEDEDDDDD